MKSLYSRSIPDALGIATIWTLALAIVFMVVPGAWGASETDQESLRTAGYIKLAGADPGESWEQGSIGTPPAHRTAHTAIWTGSEMIVWGGAFYDGTNLNYYADGARYNPAANNWTAVNDIGAPTKRDFHSAVWTGREMIVWGGFDGMNFLGDGWRYDPAADSWTPMAANGAPDPRDEHTAVWTGGEMVIWGGDGSPGALGDGARYDPAIDAWQPVSATGAPGQRYDHTAVWTGSEMIVWGGYYYLNGDQYLGDGARYNPAMDSWTAVTTNSAPTQRQYHQAVWTGSEMIVWGGYYNDGRDQFAVDGGRYDPRNDLWAPMTMNGAPGPRTMFSAVWTGRQMIVWGGSSEFGQANDGGGYDPDADSWMTTSTTGTPSPRAGATAIWTGNEMIVWGGYAGGNSNRYFNDGGRYDPASDSWKAVSSGGPPGRYLHSTVWTGSEMIAWGGYYYYDNAGNYLNDGSRYNPASDSWAPVSLSGAPSARQEHSAVWTGSEMIVWGGYFSDGSDHYLGDGARYNPILDSWTAVSAMGAPAGRAAHNAVWTGQDMIVWGGFYYANGSHNLNDGARYNPSNDAWVPMSAAGAPAGRSGSAAAWSGTEYIVWGGTADSGDAGDGGRYNPSSDQWRALASAGAPSARHGHTAVWTGSEFAVWGGGAGLDYFNDGGRYNPMTDQWKPITTNGAPSPRYAHSAVWTGSEMIIWGGDFFFNTDSYLNSGGRYSPAADGWSAVKTLGEPPGRYYHSAVWTGTEMLVWGGYGDAGYLHDTWIYRPASPKVRSAADGVDTLLVAWPYPSSGFNLEQNVSPVGTGWTNGPQGAVQSGTEWQLTVPMVDGAHFFRLRKP